MNDLLQMSMKIELLKLRFRFFKIGFNWFDIYLMMIRLTCWMYDSRQFLSCFCWLLCLYCHVMFSYILTTFKQEVYFDFILFSLKLFWSYSPAWFGSLSQLLWPSTWQLSYVLCKITSDILFIYYLVIFIFSWYLLFVCV